MSATYNAAAANEASAYDILGNPNYPPVYPSMQSPHALETVGDLSKERFERLFSAADAERARKSVFERVEEIYKDEKKILAVRAKAEQRTNPKSPDFKSNFNAEEVLQRGACFVNTKEYSFRDALMGQFREWWLARLVDLRYTV
ncbi:MAG: hypothetical protein LQ349_008933 [Xanthoria aureola]|nr:MAG: hypothetical protein LQ349_008933 [Xanthoria aureola]